MRDKGMRMGFRIWRWTDVLKLEEDNKKCKDYILLYNDSSSSASSRELIHNACSECYEIGF